MAETAPVVALGSQMTLKLILMVAAGGALGSAARFLTVSLAASTFGLSFPYGTLIVNVMGSFLMGVLVELLAIRSAPSEELRVLLGVGFLGGFTTFSAFSLDFAALAARKAYDLALLYVVGSVLLSLLAIFAGMALVRALSP
jgi:CrcB protein